MKRGRPGGWEHGAGDGNLLLCKLLQPAVLTIAGHGGRRRDVELAVLGEDRQRDPLVGADLRTLTVAVAAQPLTELARHVHPGPRDGPLTTLRVTHQHGLPSCATTPRHTDPTGHAS